MSLFARPDNSNDIDVDLDDEFNEIPSSSIKIAQPKPIPPSKPTNDVVSTQFDEQVVNQLASDVFKKLKPSCAGLASSLPLIPFQPKQDLKEVESALDTHLYTLGSDTAPVACLLATFIAIPLIEVLKHKASTDGNMEQALKILTKLLENAKGGGDVDKAILSQILAHVPLIISQGGMHRLAMKAAQQEYNKQAQQASMDTGTDELKPLRQILLAQRPPDPPPIPDELIMASLSCIQALLSLNVSEELKRGNHRPQVNHLISTLLDVTTSPRTLPVRLEALKTLQLVLEKAGDADFLVNILPGTWSTMGKLTVRDGTENHKIVVGAVQVMNELLLGLLSDSVNWSLLEKLGETVEKPLIPSVKPETLPPGGPVMQIDRDTNWLTSTRNQINAALLLILPGLRMHSNHKVRASALTMAKIILTACPINLSSSVPLALDTVLLLSNDEQSIVSEQAQAFLETIKAEKYRKALRQNFIAHFSSLPKKLQAADTDDRNKIQLLSILTGYLMTGQDMAKTINPIIPQISMDLLHALELDHGKVTDQSLKDVRFKNFHEEKTTSTLAQFVACLGKFGDFPFLMDHFFNLLSDGVNQAFQPQCLWIMRQLVIGSASSPHPYNVIWHDCLQQLSTSSLQSSSDPWVLTNYIQLVSALAQALKNDTQDLLPMLLYPLLEQLDSSNEMIRHASQNALDKVAQVFGKEDAASLVMNNIDYIIDVASAKMRHLADNPQVTHVLNASIKLAGEKVLPFVQDTVEECLDAMDEHQSDPKLVASLMQVLDNLIQAIPQPSNLEKKADVKPTAMQRYFAENLAQQQDMERSHLSLEEIAKGFEEHRRESEDIEPPNQEEPITPNQALLLQILEKNRHFLSHDNPQIRLLLLRMFRNAIPVLSQRTDKYYPVIHKWWPGIMSRMEDKDKSVQLEAIKFVGYLMESGTDFLTQRVLDNVWPKCLTMLQKLAASTIDKGDNGLAVEKLDPMYKFTLHGKLLSKILETLGLIVNHVPLGMTALEAIQEATWQHLDEQKEAPHIVQAAVNLWTALAKRDQHGTWIMMQTLLDSVDIPAWFKHKHPTSSGFTNTANSIASLVQ